MSFSVIIHHVSQMNLLFKEKKVWNIMTSLDVALM